MKRACPHIEAVADRDGPIEPSSRGCIDCLRTGSMWVHLRLCLACGHVGCCDDSPRRHARAHFHETGHPVVRSFEPGEEWAACFVDGRFVRRLVAFPEERAPRHYAPP